MFAMHLVAFSCEMQVCSRGLGVMPTRCSMKATLAHLQSYCRHGYFDSYMAKYNICAWSKP
eukprot:930128-Amphidinium_carterae.1